MRKLFLLLPTLLLTVALNAAVVNITPDGATDLRHAVRDVAVAGDTVVLADGTYTQGGDYTYFDKNIVVMAAEGANPVVKFTVPAQIKGGARAEFIGIKFDMENLHGQTWYEHLIYATDATAGNVLVFDGCEFYNDTLNNSVIYCSSSNLLDSIIVKDCKFHDIMKSCIFVESTSFKGLHISNSTFYNISTNTTSYWAGVIDIRATGCELRVDHCTFYNVIPTNTDYSAVSKVTLANGIVSNCIFMLPTAQDGIRAMRGVTANNCITYNYLKDSGTGIHSSVTKNNCIVADPLFADAANGDFSLAGNWVTMSLSPARGAATDGSDLGDPRWAVAETLPETNFAEPYDLVGAKAQITGNIWYNNTDDYLYYNDKSECGTAKWKLHIGRQSAVTAIIDMEETSASGSIFQIVVLDANGEEVGKVTAPYKDDDADIEIPGMLYFPAEGDYTIKLLNNQSHSSAKLKKITLSYMGGAVQSLPGTTDIDDAWFISGTRTASTKITFTSGHVDEGWAKWNVSFASAANYNVKLNIISRNGKKFTVALQDENGDDVVTPLYLSRSEEASETPIAVTLEMGSMEVPAGNYILKVSNAEKYSDAELVSVQFVRAGGGLVDIPGNLTFDEVILSERAWIDNDSILFTARGDEGHNSSQSAKWNVHSAGGWYSFTVNGFNANANNENGQQYTISVLSGDETTTLTTKTSAWAHPGASSCTTNPVELPEGNYVVKVQNPLYGSTGRVLSVTSTYEGGTVVEIPANPIPLTDAIITVGATRNGSGLGFNGSVSEYAQWNIEAAAGVYNFTLTVTGSNHSIYKLDVLDGGDNIFTYSQGQSGAGTVTINNVFIPAAGNYVLQLANVNSSADGVITSISAVLDDVLILDENATDAAYISAVNGETKKIILNRTFKGGMYNTICLPFSDWVSSLELVFGTGYELLELNTAELDGDVLNLNFTAVTGEFGHGRPYLIKPTHDVTNPTWTTLDGRKIDASTGYNIKSSTNADFIGSFVKGEVPAGEDNLFLGPDNLLYFSQTATPIKGTRAYFRVKGVANPAQAIKRARIVTGGQVATEINLVNESAKIGKSAKIIENGQLVIIRDGIRYNVMGAMIK